MTASNFPVTSTPLKPSWARQNRAENLTFDNISPIKKRGVPTKKSVASLNDLRTEDFGTNDDPIVCIVEDEKIYCVEKVLDHYWAKE